MPKKLSLPFEEYNYEQRRLSKHFQKRKPAYKGDIVARTKAHYCRKEVFVFMGPNDVVAELAILGINVTSETVRNYVKWGLIPTPFRKSLGRGKGRISIYPEETPEEFYASYRLMHKVEGIRLSPDNVAELRALALEAEKDPFQISLMELVLYTAVIEHTEKRNIPDMPCYIPNYMMAHLLAMQWLKDRCIAEATFHEIQGEFRYYVDDDGNIDKQFIPGGSVRVTFKTSRKFREKWEKEMEKEPKEGENPVMDIAKLLQMTRVKLD